MRSCRMGDIFLRSHISEALGRVQNLGARRMNARLGPGALLSRSSSRRYFCASIPAMDSLSAAALPPLPANPGLGNTLRPHSQRRIGLKKDPSSDKYHLIRAAKKAAVEAYIPAHPVPEKIRAGSEDAGDGGESPLICPGCGVYMQDEDPMKPGYFRVPVRLEHKPDREEELNPEQMKKLEELFDDDLQEEQEDTTSEKKKTKKKGKDENYTFYEIVGEEMTEVKKHEFSSPDDVPSRDLASLDDSWGDVVEGSMEREARKKQKNLLKNFSKRDNSNSEEAPPERMVICARCHSLKYYGRVKEKSAEGLLPSFDFDKMVGKRLRSAYGKRAVVVMVVDAADFDGSFPRDVAKLISEVEEKISASRRGETGGSPRLIVVATKVDLLPGQVSPLRLEQWVRRRVIIGGAPRPVAVHLVSSTKHWGVKALTERICRVAGPRGDVWVVGSQNAGKSSLINALARFNVGKHLSRLTEANHPGTTIGILKMVGILPQGIKLFDTPGILQPHQLCLRLEEEELKMVQIRKELKPRTYRIMPGYSIHLGGYMRLDLLEAPARTIYVTVWASPLISMHMGKTFKAVDMFKNHLGVELQPPGSLKSWFELGDFKSQKIKVRGDSWESSSVDISIAGLGWLGLGLKGEALLELWTFDGVGISTREALVYDYARVFETPGFTVIHQTPEKDYKKRPSNAERSFNRRKDRLADEKARAARSGVEREATPLIEEAKVEIEGEPMELW